MSITFDEKNRIFHLQTPDTSYIMRLMGDYILEHVYYGERLEDLTGITYTQYDCKSFAVQNYEYEGSEQRISTEMIPQEYAFYGSCDMRKPSFHATYADGSRITKMKYVSHKISAAKPKLDGLPATYTEDDSEADTLEIVMKDELTGLVHIYRYTAFSHIDAIARSVTVKNDGTRSININEIMSCNVDFRENDFDFIHLCGSWAKERHIERKGLIQGRMQIESRRGSSSHHHSPFFALAKKNTTEESGEVYGFSLVYSGNFEAGIEADTFGGVRAFMGINSFDFSWNLEPGETFTAPEVVMVYSSSGIGNMSRIYHRLYRTRLARGIYRDAERPVLINNWEATYFDFNEEKIIEIAKTAKRAGIELMVLDDGWFGKRDDDTSSLGDWYTDTNKLPNGISGLAEKITALGMKFGLWFEPEMVSPNSDLYRAHPDWCLHVNGRGRSCGRHQLILDLSREDVCEYIVSFMTEILGSAPISYVKWDMNRNMSEIGSAELPPEKQAETAHRYMLGLYKVLETLVRRFPNVLFEGCSGGGGRFDAGMMHYFNQYWTSDVSDAIERLYIQHGTSMVMPSAFMGAHVSAVPNHQVNRVTPMTTRGAVAMCGQFGYELDITKSDNEEIQEISEQIELYKSIRAIVHNGDMYRIESPFEGENVVWEYLSENKKTVLVFCFRIMGKPQQMSRQVKLCGLDKTAMYKLRDTQNVYSGDMLMKYGVQLERMGDFSSKLLIFDAVE